MAFGSPEAKPTDFFAARTKRVAIRKGSCGSAARGCARLLPSDPDGRLAYFSCWSFGILLFLNRTAERNEAHLVIITVRLWH